MTRLDSDRSAPCFISCPSTARSLYLTELRRSLVRIGGRIVSTLAEHAHRLVIGTRCSGLWGGDEAAQATPAMLASDRCSTTWESPCPISPPPSGSIAPSSPS